MPHRRADQLAVLTLVLLATLLFLDVLLGINGFYVRDLARYHYPAKQVLREAVLHGEFPYWNRDFAAGQPLAANPAHEVFYPLTWLILLPSFDFGFRLLILLHIHIALLGMYALLRSLELRPFPSWFGAVSWGLGGLYLSYVNVLPFLFSAAWLPLTCLFVRRFLLRRSGRDFALASLFLGLQFLVGEPTTVIQTGMLIGIYAVYRAWYARSIAPLLWIAAIAAAGFAVGAAQMLPAIDFAGDSVRALPFGFDVVSQWSMPWARLGELAYPKLLGRISFTDGFWYWGGRLYPYFGAPFLFSIYAGLLVLALALGGAFVRPRGGRLVLILCTVSTLFAVGVHTPLLLWLYRAHIGTSLRHPEKFALLGVFTVVVFAAQMFDRLMSGDATLRARTTVILGLATGIAVAMFAASFTPTYSRVLAMDRAVELSRADWLVAVLRGLIAIAVVRSAARNGRLWILAAASFVAVDLAWTLAPINPRIPRSFFDPPPLAGVLPANRHAYRLFHEADWLPRDQPPAAGYFPPGPCQFWTLRNGLFPLLPGGAGIETVLQDDFDKTALLPTSELNAAMLDVQRAGRPNWQEPFMAMSNAWFRTDFRDFDAERRRTGGDCTKVKPVRFVAAAQYPRYYFADRMIAIRGRRDLVADVLANRATPRAAFVQGAPFAAAPGVVRSVAETANTASLDVESTGRGFLVMSVTRHKYWDVRVDGERVPVVPTNIAYQGIAVPRGHHRVTMVYRNPLVPVGLGVSGGAIAALLWFLVSGFWFCVSGLIRRACPTAAPTSSP